MRINLFEALLNAHITRLETVVAGRDNNNPWHNSLNEVDLKNINSLREARIPLYADHGSALPEIEMSEFSDLVEESRLATP